MVNSSTWKTVVCFSMALIWTALLYGEIEIYFSPGGGFHPKNNQQVIVRKNGEKMPATIVNSLLDLIERMDEGGEIKIVMYSFSHRPTQDALIDAAKTRNIKVKLLLDAVAEWTDDMRSSLKKRVLAELEQAKKEGRKFDFQLKEIYPQAMEDRGRLKKMEDGTVIYGTMHEKFGLFIPRGEKFALHSFCGSANISGHASSISAENRIVFRNEPAIARILAEEFARLWNEFGTPVTDNCQSEKYLPCDDNLGELKIISNSKPLDESNYLRLDHALLDLMEEVDAENGTLDVAMFSLTHIGLANKFLNLAERYPKIKVRILMDHTQLEETEIQQGVLGPYIERTAHFKNLKNIEIRYKWRSNIYTWDTENNCCRLISFRNLIFHHKCVVVNRRRMGIGSYNWSSSAEFRNFENIMIFNGLLPEHKKIIDAFMDEFDTIWNALKQDEIPIVQKIQTPQVVTGQQGRKLQKIIIAAFNDPDCKYIMQILDTHPQCSREFLLTLTKLTSEKLDEKVSILHRATLICPINTKDGMVYQLAD